MLKASSTAICVSLALGGTAAASAQESENNSQIDEIVITAQRVDSKLERTPVAVSVLSAEALDKQVITSQQDLQRAVPGLLVRETVSSNAANFALRGQSVDSGTNSPPAVSSYMNEVPIDGGDDEAATLYDIQSIQVLKGPQGTLFGRNSTGGAILITTTQPGNDFGGYLKVRGGNYKLRAVDGAMNLPIITDSLLLRVAGFIEKRRGFYTNLYDGSHPGDVDRDGGRVTLLWKPTPDVKNSLVANFTRSGGTNAASITSNYYPTGSTNNGIPLVSTLIDTYNPARVDALFGPGSWQRFLAVYPKADPLGLAHAIDAQNARDPHIINSMSENFHRGKTTTVSNITTWEMSDAVTLKNILGYISTSNVNKSDSVGMPFPISDTLFFQYRKTYSEELQILGKLFDEKLTYVAGIYLLKSNYRVGLRSLANDLSPMRPAVPRVFDTITRTNSYAGYLQGTIDLSEATGLPGLSATAGVRYTDEHTRNSSLPSSFFYNFPGMVNDLETRAKKWSYQFGLQEQVNDEFLIYGVTRRSFRGGGFNGAAPHVPGDARLGGAEFQPETATDYELGAKYKVRTGDITAAVNLAAYSQTTTNVQRRIYALVPSGTTAGFTINVPEARVRGVELDTVISPVEWLSFGGTLVYTDAKFTKNESTLFGRTTRFGPYPDTPEWTGSFFGEVTIPITPMIGNLAVRGDYYGTSSTVYSSLGNASEPNTGISGYSLVNLRISLEDIGGEELSISAGVQNVFDKEYKTGGLSFGSTRGTNSTHAGAPRTYTAEISYRF